MYVLQTCTVCIVLFNKRHNIAYHSTCVLDFAGAEILMSTATEYPYNDVYSVNPIHPIGNSLKEQKSMYIVLTPSIKPSI